MKIRLFISLYIILCSQVIFAERINENDINETFSQTVKVSGSFFLGLQYVDSQKIENLHILFPKDSMGKVCINISSIDGHYKAVISHKLSAKVSNLTPMNFPSQYETELKKYKPNELAVLAWLADDCSTQKDNYLISTWNSSKEKSNILLLIRSDARKDVVHISETNEKIKCKKFKNKYKVTYDKYCELKGFDINKIKQLKIVRKNLQAIPPVLIKLAY